MSILNAIPYHIAASKPNSLISLTAARSHLFCRLFYPFWASHFRTRRDERLIRPACIIPPATALLASFQPLNCKACTIAAHLAMTQAKFEFTIVNFPVLSQYGGLT